MKAVVANFNQEKARAFSVIVQLYRLIVYTTNFEMCCQLGLEAGWRGWRLSMCVANVRPVGGILISSLNLVMSMTNVTPPSHCLALCRDSAPALYQFNIL